MSDQFWIQAGSPRCQVVRLDDGVTLDEAVEAVFPSETEEAIVVWQHVYIPIGYRYDVSTILRDVVLMVRRLLSADEGQWELDWPSNTFSARWRFEWSEDDLKVMALEWRAVVGDTEELLRSRPVVEIGRAEFVCEWRVLLERVLAALVACDGRPPSIEPDLQSLREVIRWIERPGRLYR